MTISDVTSVIRAMFTMFPVLDMNMPFEGYPVKPYVAKSLCRHLYQQIPTVRILHILAWSLSSYLSYMGWSRSYCSYLFIGLLQIWHCKPVLYPKQLNQINKNINKKALILENIHHIQDKCFIHYRTALHRENVTILHQQKGGLRQIQ